MNCIFCCKEQLTTDIVYEDDTVLAFMDMDPVNTGHVLLITKEHYEKDGFGWTYGNGIREVTTGTAGIIKETIEQIN